ncbi:hypothetical protein I551_8872 [Mycobacterium ulcerans str. Harvey]|uniref:Uncharacterized protein n=1 Tax=Mycobacterium ulcerans str. Harvey TaxID=1299332 RepID=A0ABN0RAI8_MYCUL|nr:hypothetical protein I551_8872 [Mycobacterium ulcerans str. Harvey]
MLIDVLDETPLQPVLFGCVDDRIMQPSTSFRRASIAR